MCGEKLQAEQAATIQQGSPPRVRGKGNPISKQVAILRITPACAGKSLYLELCLLSRGDHPRVCGEKTKESLKK